MFMVCLSLFPYATVKGNQHMDLGSHMLDSHNLTGVSFIFNNS